MASVVDLLEEGLGPDMDVPRIGDTFLSALWTVTLHEKHVPPRKLHPRATSSLRGVTVSRERGGYVARDFYAGSRVYIGLFEEEDLAGLAVDLHHRFAAANRAFPDERVNFCSALKQRDILMKAMGSQDLVKMIASLKSKSVAPQLKRFLSKLEAASISSSLDQISEGDWAVLE